MIWRSKKNPAPPPEGAEASGISRTSHSGEASGKTGIAGRADFAAACVFLLLIYLFAAAGLLLPDRTFSPTENRYLAQRPVLRRRQVLSADYMRAAEAYQTDQFPGRDGWVAWKALCQRLSGQKENNGVYFAGDDYLIAKPREAPAEIAEKNLASVLAIKQAGYDTALLVSPMAAEILRDKLPFGAYTPEQAELTEMLRREAPDIFIDAETNLRQAAAAGVQVFFRTDHHWTSAGAYMAYCAYMAWLGKTPMTSGAFTEERVTEDFYGTLWSKNSLPGLPPDHISVFHPKDAGQFPACTVEYVDGGKAWRTESLYQPEFLSQKDKYAYFLGQNQALAVIRRQSADAADAADTGSIGDAEDAGDAAGATDIADIADIAEPGRLMIFKDSYAHCFVPFLLPHFTEIHLADLRYWKQDPVAYMEANGIKQVLFLYNADNFSGDRSISQIGAYLGFRL